MNSQLLKRPRVFSAVAIVCVAIAVALFQNCSQVGFLSNEVSFLKSENNGGGYGGKPDGDFYRFVPGFTCEEKESYLMHIGITASAITLTENKRLSCGAVTQNLDPDAIDTSIYQGEIIGYQEGIFEGIKETPSGIPANLVEVWCRDDRSYSGIETITHFDRVASRAVNRIYFATPNADGSFQKKIVVDFPVARIINDKTVIVKDESGFELTVHRDQPAAEAGLFVGHLNAVIDGQKVSRATSCRLGGMLDADIWPAKRIVDTNVIQMKLSPDLQSFAYSSDTGTGDPLRSHLYISNMLGTVQRRLNSYLETAAAIFDFTPDSKKVTYVDNFNPAPSVSSIGLDGKSQIVFDKVETRSSFTYSTDGKYLIYNKYDPAYSLPSLGLRSTPVGGGPIYTLNPPLSLGAMNVSSFSANKDKIVFLCCNGLSTYIYVVNPDGTDLKTLPRDLPPGWIYVTSLLAAPGMSGDLLSVWAWDMVGRSGQSANFIIAWDGSGSVKLPTGWLWTGTSPAKNWLLLRDEKDPTIAKAVSVGGNRTTTLPKLLPEAEKPIRDGNENADSRFFTGDSLSYVMLQDTTKGRRAISVSLADGVVTDICPGLNVSFVKEQNEGRLFLAGFDSATGILRVYLKSKNESCRLINSVPTKLLALDKVRLMMSDDASVALMTIAGPARDENLKKAAIAQLLYVPMDGRSAYQVNTPVIPTATLSQAFFVKGTKTVVFVGDQVRPGETGVFKWVAP